MENGKGGTRGTIVKLLKRIGAFPVENSVHVGTPDVYCSAGWIEAKYERGFSTTGAVRLKIRQTQTLWHRRASHLGWNTFVVSQIGSDWYVHSGVLIDALASTTRDDMRSTAISWWSRTPTSRELEEAIMGFKKRTGIRGHHVDQIIVDDPLETANARASIAEKRVDDLRAVNIKQVERINQLELKVRDLQEKLDAANRGDDKNP